MTPHRYHARRRVLGALDRKHWTSDVALQRLTRLPTRLLRLVLRDLARGRWVVGGTAMWGRRWYRRR